MGVVEDLVQARKTFERGDWLAAFEAWWGAGFDALGPDDLASLGTAAYLIGKHDEAASALHRAYATRVDEGDRVAAARCAFWLGMLYSLTREEAARGGWTARGKRLLDDEGADCVEHGYLAILSMQGHLVAGDWANVAACAEEVTAYGHRYADANLLTTGLSSQGRLFLLSGRVPEGLALFDEAMIAVTAGEVSPVFAGSAYCRMIEGCQDVCDFGRAAAWTAALSRWCAAQPGLVPFTGQCAVHRGQIMRMSGAYREAVDEFSGAVHRYELARASASAGLALAERGDTLRSLGDLDAAEESYGRAAEYGHEPQPGLALLWLDQGRGSVAEAAVRRLLAERSDPVSRCRLLPAAIAVLRSRGHAAQVGELVTELDEIAAAFGCVALQAMAAYAHAQLELDRGDAAGALPYARKSGALWMDLDCPYEVAQSRLLTARAMAELGDAESSRGELGAARRTFTDLETTPALRETDRILSGSPYPAGLTAREIEVLALVATGKTNADIAASLVLSEKTVARHLSNIFSKIDVASRTAAAAYAIEHHLT